MISTQAQLDLFMDQAENETFGKLTNWRTLKFNDVENYKRKVLKGAEIIGNLVERGIKVQERKIEESK